jgi:solute carrier family 25, member 42
MDSSAVDVSKRLIAGGIAGSLAKTVIAPLDRTKIIFQTSSKVFNARNAFNEMVQICKLEGLHGLWRGNSATVLRVFPYAGIQFCSFDLYKKMFSNDDTGHLTSLQRLGAGSAAGATAVAITYPLDLLRARLAVQRHVAGGAPLSYRHALSAGQEGVRMRDLYRGLSPTLLGILPYAGIAFYTRDTLNGVAARRLETDSLNTPLAVKLGSGAISGLIAQSSTYPLDLVRRRMQTEGYTGAEAAAAAAPRITDSKYVSIAGTLRTIYSEGGSRALFKGLSMNWIKGPVAFMISFTVFDYLKLFFHIRAAAAEDFRRKPVHPAVTDHPPPHT